VGFVSSCFFWGFLLALPCRLYAQVTTNAPAPGTLVLSLEHCLELALGGNLDIALGRREPLARGEDFFIAGEVFTPVVALEGRVEELERRTANTQIGADIFEEEQRVVEGSIRKKWPLGTRTDLVWAYTKREDNSEFRTLNPSHDSSVALAVIQPLFKGFGVAVNRVDLQRAIHDREIADHEFEILLEGELLATYRAYWELVRAASDLDLQETSLALAREQVAIVRDRLDVGTASSLDVTSARAGEARQEEAVIAALNAYRKASDHLLLKIRPAGGGAVEDLRVIPSTEPDFSGGTPALPALGEAIRLAGEMRPELRLESARIARADVDVREAESERRPRVNLFGRYGYGGLAADAGDSVDDLLETSFPEWTAGVSLEFFFMGKSRKARWRQAVLERESADLRRELAAALIRVDVRAAAFDLEAAIQRLEATRRTLALAREQYEGEVDRLRAGRSTVFQVDRFRRDLLGAERNHLDARIDILVAQAVCRAAQGDFAKSIIGSVTDRTTP